MGNQICTVKLLGAESIGVALHFGNKSLLLQKY